VFKAVAALLISVSIFVYALYAIQCPLIGGPYPMRRTLSFILASALLLAGIALAGFEITHAEALRPFVLFGALVIVVAAGLWLIDEFIWPVWRH
jgi:hypothetical protein